MRYPESGQKSTLLHQGLKPNRLSQPALPDRDSNLQSASLTPTVTSAQQAADTTDQTHPSLLAKMQNTQMEREGSVRNQKV